MCIRDSRQAVLQGLARIAAVDTVDTSGIGRQAEDRLVHLVAGELIVRRQQRVRFGRALALLDLCLLYTSRCV